MILTVSDDNHCTALLALDAETAHGCIDGLADGCTLYRDRTGRDRIQEHLRRYIVRRDRKLDKRVSGEDDKTYPVLTKFVHKTGDSQLGSFKSVWRIIFRKHRIRHVKHYHDFRSLGLVFLQLRSYLRS